MSNDVIQGVSGVALLESDAEDGELRADWRSCATDQSAQHDRRDAVLEDHAGPARGLR
jgi:hypothetical protein